MTLEIMTRDRLELALDSSSLNALLNDGAGAVDQFAAHARSAGLRVVLCEHVMVEVVVQGAPTHSSARARMLQRLSSRLDTELVLSAPLRRMFEHERRANGYVPSGTAYLAVEEASRVFAFLGSSDYAGWQARVREEPRSTLGADRLYARDQGLRDLFKERFPDATPENVLEMAEDPALGRWMLEVVLEEDDDACQRVLSDPGSHRSLSVFSGYAHLNAVASATRSERRGRYDWLTSRSGDWTDAAIAGQYAYATWVVTEDRGQAARMRFLERRGRSFARVIALDDVNQATTP